MINLTEMEIFKYADGRIVHTGDVVSCATPGDLGVVALVAVRGSENAEIFQSENGGIFIHYLNGCDVFYDDLSDEEDIEYVRSFDVEIRRQFEQCGRTFARYLTGEAMHIGDLVEYSNGGCLIQGRVSRVVAPFSQESWGTDCVLGACEVNFNRGGRATVRIQHTLRLISRH